MTKIWIFVALVVFGLLTSGCTEQEVGMATQGKAGYNVVLPDDLHIDSAQVFFFRNLAHIDTLIMRETIYDIGTSPKRFEFDLPAGYYLIAFWGNIGTDRIVERPPYSRDSIWFSYQGGIEPPEIYHGLNYFNIGTDTSGLLGMGLLVSRIELTLKNIPAGISRIEAPVSNTSSGIGFYGYLKVILGDTTHIFKHLEVSGPVASTFGSGINTFPTYPETPALLNIQLTGGAEISSILVDDDRLHLVPGIITRVNILFETENEVKISLEVDGKWEIVDGGHIII